MQPTLSSTAKPDLQGLIRAIDQAQTEDSLTNPLTSAQWEVVSAYLQPCILEAGRVLFAKGISDRTLYWVESGTLSVHYEDEKSRVRMAMVGAGSVVGEGAFFSRSPRSATVQAATPCRLWALTALRFGELTNRQPAIALGLSMAAGEVLAKRLGNRRRRVAST